MAQCGHSILRVPVIRQSSACALHAKTFKLHMRTVTPKSSDLSRTRQALDIDRQSTVISPNSHVKSSTITTTTSHAVAAEAQSTSHKKLPQKPAPCSRHIA